MVRIQLGKRIGRSRRRHIVVVALGIAGAGLATAVWATTAGTSDDPEALSRTIKAQKIRAGFRIADQSLTEHQIKALSSDQMIELAARYDVEMHTLLERAEIVRVSAYRSRDIIRMSCIEDKLAQMRAVIRIAEPRFLTIKTVKSEELNERSQFSIIQQAIDRVRALVSEMESCLGDSLDKVAGGRFDDDPTTGAAEDPTEPQQPGLVLDRPPEASGYQ